MNFAIVNTNDKFIKQENGTNKQLRKQFNNEVKLFYLLNVFILEIIMIIYNNCILNHIEISVVLWNNFNFYYMECIYECLKQRNLILYEVKLCMFEIIVFLLGQYEDTISVYDTIMLKIM